jgi:predicted enzyme related to lactoylglutathione lyase
MALIEKHAPGSFCWVELMTTDQNAAKDFYTTLFGWTAEDTQHSYMMFKMDGKDTGACYTMRPDQKAQGIPPHWDLYIAVENADETTSKATAAGAKVFAPPFDVMDYGRMAVLQDPTGAVFCLWQPKTHIGIRYAGQDNSFCWADLSTGDVARARQFYSDVFGWKISPGERDTSGYLHIENGKDMIGGIQPESQRNPNAPPHWMLYFMVADVDDKAAKTQQAGGQIYMPPTTIEGIGRMAIVADPQGAVFALFRSARQGS